MKTALWMILLGSLAVAHGSNFEPMGAASVFRYNGPGNALDQALAISALPDGGAVIVGSSRGAGGQLDAIIIRMEDDGTPSSGWPDIGFGPGIRRFDNRIGRDDVASAVAVGVDGAVYVAGFSNSLNTFEDYLVLKLTAAGDFCPTWPDTGAGVGVRRYSRLGGYDQALAIAVDADGSVFVTGRSAGVTVPAAIATLKYSATGSLLWARAYSGPGVGENRGIALALTGDGGVVVGGDAMQSNGRFAYVLLRYDAAGNLSSAWPTAGQGAGVRIFAGPSGAAAEMAGMMRLPGGGYAATGRVDLGGGNFAATTVAWGANGAQLWSAQRRAGSMASDQGVALRAGSDGSVYVATRSSLEGGAAAVEILRYGSGGALSSLWPDLGHGNGVRRWTGPGGVSSFPVALAKDRLGNVYVTGRATITGGTIFALKFAPGGQQLFEGFFSGPGNALDHPAALAISANDSILVAGRSDGGWTGADLLLLSWRQEFPRILFSPGSTLATVGSGITLRAEASVSPGRTTHAQWYRNGVLLGSGLSLGLGPFQPSLAGTYELRVSDGFNTVSVPFSIAGIGMARQNSSPVVQVHGPSGHVFTIESSTDLANWTPFHTFTHPGGTATFAVPDGGRMFFRLKR